MLEALLTAFARFEKVHIARSEEERSAIFRMRYRIYVNEQNELNAAGADHERRELRTPIDDLPESTHFYIGRPANLRGSLRLRVWRPGQIPRDFYHRYSLNRFPDIETRTVGNVAYLMTLPSLRGTADVAALTCGALEHSIANLGAEVLIADCVPGLLNAYRRLGLRPYGAKLLSMSRGVQIPVADIARDLEHHRRCRSPWYYTLRQIEANGKLPTRDASPLFGPFAHGGGVESDPARILAVIEAAVARREAPFLARLSPKTRQKMVPGAVLFDIEPGMDVLVEGFIGRDVFVILEGALELRLGDERSTDLGPGDVIGEDAFFRGSGQHLASVRSISRCRLLHFRVSFLRRLADADPAAGVDIYDSFTTVLMDRVVSSGPSGC